MSLRAARDVAPQIRSKKDKSSNPALCFAKNGAPICLVRDAKSKNPGAPGKNPGAPGVQTVLVSVDSMDAIREAYPNYYADTGDFVAALEEAIKGVKDVGIPAVGSGD